MKNWLAIGQFSTLTGLSPPPARSVRSVLARRLDAIVAERDLLADQRQRVGYLLSSIHQSKDRGEMMKLLEKNRIVVTGVEGLTETAETLREKLPGARIVHGPKPAVVELRPEVILIRNFGPDSKANGERYLRLYAGVSDATTTILNADDRSSIEFAKESVVQKGRIYYYSKNSELCEQIRKIGGVVSEGEGIEMFGSGACSRVKLENILSYREEISLLASWAVVMDMGLAV